MQLDPATNADAVPPRRKRRRQERRRRKPVDGRTFAARRVRELTAGYLALLGGAVSPELRRLCERAAQLTALAEDTRRRALTGAGGVGLDDLVRIENLADRAVRALRLDQKRETAHFVPLRDQEYGDVPEYGAEQEAAPDARAGLAGAATDAAAGETAAESLDEPAAAAPASADEAAA